MQPQAPSNFLPQLLRTVGAWAVALLLFFPLGWLPANGAPTRYGR